jgi:hypothetical protein
LVLAFQAFVVELEGIRRLVVRMAMPPFSCRVSAKPTRRKGARALP